MSASEDATQAVTDVRRRVTWDTHGRRGRKSDPAWTARRRLLRGPERLSEAQFTRMRNDLIDGDPSGAIVTAWVANEELRALLATDRRGEQRHDVAHRLHRFNSWCAFSGRPELERLAGTIQAGWPEVLGFLQTQVTNAGTEATNRTVKTAARTAYGFRNLDNQRRRVRSPVPGNRAGPPPAEGAIPLKLEEPTRRREHRPPRRRMTPAGEPTGSLTD